MSIRDQYATGLDRLWDQLRRAFGQGRMTAMIQSRAPASGGYLDAAPTWEAVASGVPCVVKPLKAETLALQGRDADKAWARIYFRADPGVGAGDRIIAGGRTYAATQAVEPDAAGLLWSVDCTAVG